MKQTIRMAVLLLVLAGCSGTNSKTANTAAGAGPTTSPPPSTAPTTTAPHPEGNPFPQRVGASFTFKTNETTLQMTVERPMTCGIRGYSIPEDIATGEAAYKLSAPRGMRYCDVDISLTNVGKRQVQLSLGGNLYDTQGRQFEYDTDATTAVGNADQVDNFGSNTIELRPTETKKTVVVFPIPIGAAPAYMELADSGVTETIDGVQLWARVNVAGVDVTWVHPRGQ